MISGKVAYLWCLSTVCFGTFTIAAEVHRDFLLHSESLDEIVFINTGNYSLKITNDTFLGFNDSISGKHIKGINPEQLEALTQINRINGNLIITANHPDFTNLTCLRNLKVVVGFPEAEASISVTIANTSLSFLNLPSLIYIGGAGIRIENNKNLCTNQSNPFWRIFRNKTLKVANNKAVGSCKVCDQECEEEEGCWGPGPGECKMCRNYWDSKWEICVGHCDPWTRYYQPEDFLTCQPCHEECTGCYGPSNLECDLCQHFQRDNMCVPLCHSNEYKEDGLCKKCHEDCLRGCSGPLESEGGGGCHPCPKPLLSYLDHADGRGCIDSGIVLNGCLNASEECPGNYFLYRLNNKTLGISKHLLAKDVCVQCHKYCLRCTSYGFDKDICQECEFDECLCPEGTYYDERWVQYDLCSPQSGNVKHIFNCIRCRDHKNRSNENFCPVINITSPSGKLPDQDSSKSIISGVIILIISACFVSVLLIFWRKSELLKSQVRGNNMLEESEDPVDEPSNRTPNMSKLLIVKESDVKKSAVLGSGAFGEVYRGVLFLEKRTVQLPVAIKVVNTQSNETSTKDLLSEASIMGRMNHPSLLRLLAVCVTSNVMLISQLMPLGDLLTYLRKNVNRISPKTLVNWCTQISKGMAFLEENRLVHRDLAARNVLIQNWSRVKVADFGLARALGIDQDQYASRGGRLPIKWMALESITRGIFTHKTDVWSFGVTVWEVLTFGDEPFEETPARELAEFLKSGERLPQPKSCSVDVYSILATCWAEEPSARPSFSSIVETFLNLSKNPGNFMILSAENRRGLEQCSTHRYSEIDEDNKDDDGQCTETTAIAHKYENVDQLPESLDSESLPILHKRTPVVKSANICTKGSGTSGKRHVYENVNQSRDVFDGESRPSSSGHLTYIQPNFPSSPSSSSSFLMEK